MPEKKPATKAEVPVKPAAKAQPHPDSYSQVLRNEVVCINPYAAFAAKPINTRFETQAENEHILLLVRRHPIAELRWGVIAIILALMPLALQFIPLLNFFPTPFQIFAVIGWYMLILGYVLESFLSWFFHVNIITDERIIDIDFISLLHKRISSAKIDNIQDLTSGVKGFLGSIVNYGDVEIQTSAEQREFIFDQIPQPEKVGKLLNELIVQEEQEKLEGRAS